MRIENFIARTDPLPFPFAFSRGCLLRILLRAHATSFLFVRLLAPVLQCWRRYCFHP